jgi:hypothetical protein
MISEDNRQADIDVFSPEFREAFDRAYQAWFERLVQERWKREALAPMIGDSLLQGIDRLWPAQQRAEDHQRNIEAKAHA